ncbi:aspartate aminotransferase-like enzyme [Melghirimyces profundicolus]|uniref:Aspartate aminotransferase-like enzyme n=1 Tax=Melghirimyces profundicolus TaxID=1242148 RepID=A0A2T6BV68_9BACL|nr:alanine--glyoxylate aminotransferase family protein [Melghirimyces profundicolus]PTX59867.1 aspartate aminotransferase-like enzyme [Melghirimyces profundicolus]
MLKDKYRLQIPGPTPIPPRVQLAMSRPMIGHRDPDCSRLVREVSRRLGPVFGTQNPVLLLTGSGTSALEAAAANLLAEGEEAAVVVTGAFGDRFANILNSMRVKVHRLDVEWGKACHPEQLDAFLEQHPRVKAVFLTFCETSTGVLNPIRELVGRVRERTQALTVVDGVSCVGGVPAEADRWGIDILVAGSQKALMLPPGLAFAAVSDRAWNAMETNPHPRFYLDLSNYRKSLEKDTTPNTPAVSLLFGLKEVLDMLDEEGMETVFSRHRLMMEMTRAGIRALDLELLTEDRDASPTVTAVKGGKTWSSEDLRKELRRLGLRVAGGQQHLKGKIFRIGHMGYADPLDVLTTLSALEVALARIGAPVETGAGTQAAEEEWIRVSRADHRSVKQTGN